ncbi:BA14K family protein [Segnochrobactrum spirostomi]|uniref:BA14K family protein n=1 Tax=Segnochrobactrum spirostomi TaxID=2608987 RepID=UPI0035E4400C
MAIGAVVANSQRPAYAPPPAYTGPYTGPYGSPGQGPVTYYTGAGGRVETRATTPGDVAMSQSAYRQSCAARYRSYDPASGTYLGYDGLRHPC